MSHNSITRKTGNRVVKMVIIGMVIQLSALAYVFYQSFQGRVDLVENQRTSCKARGNVANKANADFQNAHTKYITTVTIAKDVPDDVRAAAIEAVITFNRTSAILTRLASADCNEVFPKASFLP